MDMNHNMLLMNIYKIVLSCGVAVMMRCEHYDSIWKFTKCFSPAVNGCESAYAFFKLAGMIGAGTGSNVIAIKVL